MLTRIATPLAATMGLFVVAQAATLSGMAGLSDGTCPPKTGRSSRDRYVKNNKRKVSATVPETTVGSGSHKIYDYEGCGNHPVNARRDFLRLDGDWPRPKIRSGNRMGERRAEPDIRLGIFPERHRDGRSTNADKILALAFDHRRQPSRFRPKP